MFLRSFSVFLLSCGSSSAFCILLLCVRLSSSPDFIDTAKNTGSESNYHHNGKYNLFYHAFSFLPCRPCGTGS